MAPLSYSGTLMGCSCYFTLIGLGLLFKPETVSAGFFVDPSTLNIRDIDTLASIGSIHLYLGGMLCVGARVKDAHFRHGVLLVEVVALAASIAYFFFAPAAAKLSTLTRFTMVGTWVGVTAPSIMLLMESKPPAKRASPPSSLWRWALLAESTLHFVMGVAMVFAMDTVLDMVGLGPKAVPLTGNNTALLGLVGVMFAAVLSGWQCMYSGVSNAADRRSYLCVRACVYLILVVLRARQLGWWGAGYGAALAKVNDMPLDGQVPALVMDAVLAAPSLFMLFTGAYKAKGKRD